LAAKLKREIEMERQHVYGDNFGGLPAEERMQTRMAALDDDDEE
jgi:hypothetical protein